LLLINQKGFTLIEIIVGMITLSIAFSVLITLIYPLANQSAEQVHQIRAAELAQSTINEILGKAFDQNSDMSGGYFRCGEDQNIDGDINGDELCSSTLGSDGIETRATFNDVDDYDNVNTIEDSAGNSLDYVGFSINISVVYDGDYDGVDDGNNNNPVAKLITVNVTTPQDFIFTFAVYKANF